MSEIAEAEATGVEKGTPDWKVNTETNRWPEWVFMQLEPGAASAGSLDLHLTINFNEHHATLLKGKVSYGLVGGDLKLVLTGGRIPYKFREPKTPLEIQLSAERSITDITRGSSKSVRSATVGLGVSESKGTDSTTKVQSQSETVKGKERQTTDKFPHAVFQMTTKGSEEQPLWSFDLKSDDPVLTGRLDQFKLGTLHVQGGACRIIATFKILRRHIRITGGDGVWPDDLGRNHRAIVDGLIRRLLANRLLPFMSRLEVSYE